MPNKTPDAELLPMTSAVSKAYTEEVHAYLMSLLTNPGRFREANDRFHASYNAVLGGDIGMVAACEEDRKELDRQYALLVGIAKAVAPQDPSVPDKLGLGPFGVKTAVVSTPIPTPGNFKLVHGKNSGEMTGTVSSVKGARMFEVWGCEGDPNLEQNWKLVAASPNCRRIDIKGLTPGTKYWFKVRAVRSGDIGPWSNYINLMAI